MNYDIPKCPITRTRDVRYQSVYPDYSDVYMERELNAFDINREIINSDCYIAYTAKMSCVPHDEPSGPTRMKTEYIPVESCTESFVPPTIDRLHMENVQEVSYLSDHICIESQVDSISNHLYNDIEAANNTLIDMSGQYVYSYPINDKDRYVEPNNDITEKYPDEHVIDINEIECIDTTATIDNLDLSRVTLTRGSNNVYSEDENPEYWKFIDEHPNYWDYYEDVDTDNDDDLKKPYTEEDLEYESDSTHSSMPGLIEIELDSDDE